MVLVSLTPISSTARHEFKDNVDIEELALPWQSLEQLLRDVDFISVVITTRKDQYIISKDGSW